MKIQALKSWPERLLAKFARMIVVRGLRPEAAALLAYVQRQDALAEQRSAEWMLRRCIPSGAVDLLISPVTQENGAPAPLSEAALHWARWLARDCIAHTPDGLLQMPLVRNVNSDHTAAPFFAGENIQLMEGSIVSADSRIGGNSYVGFNCHITKSTIGRYVSIADSVLIGPGEHYVKHVSTSSLFYAEPYQSLTRDPCVIQDDVWIGASCIIRRGVTIGTGAVIGANSFVNRDVPPFAIMAGSPACCIGYRFRPEAMEKILQSHWWELPIAEAGELIAKLTQEIGDLNDS